MMTKVSSVFFICLVISCSAPRKEAEDESQVKSSQTLPGMIWIKGGQFTMGSSEDKPDANAMVPHTVKIHGFWMDETEVTNAQFKNFVDATGYVTVAERPLDWEELRKQAPPGTAKPSDDLLQPGSLVFVPPADPVILNDYSQWWRWVVGANWRHPEGPGSSVVGKDNYPVVHIAYEDAEAYAKWADKRLPTEAEFEFAARGGNEGKCYAWGEELNPDGKYLANYFQGAFPINDTAEDGFNGLSPVKAFPPNAFGLYDLIGNVWELCSDWYSVDASQHANALVSDPVGPKSTQDPSDPLAIKHVSKGGSFVCSAQYCSNYKPSGRQGSAYDSGMSHTGFRCVKDADKP